MKNYSLFFDDNRFSIDITEKPPHTLFYELFSTPNQLFILVPLPGETQDALKIIYPRHAYEVLLKKKKNTLLWQFSLLSLIAIAISILFSFYVLRPIRESLKLLEMFIKDIIHDLNTPLTSILINLKMIDSKSEELESIAQSAKTIAMLHHNLNAYLKDDMVTDEKFDLKEVIDEQVAFFKPLYDYLTWEVNIDTLYLHTDKATVGRIIYNLLSNACKYNTSHGFIRITLQGKRLSISNSSYGIRNPSKIFERFYRESDRGLGIGLHIVDKLCNQLRIQKEFEIKNNIITFTLDFKEVTLY